MKFKRNGKMFVQSRDIIHIGSLPYCVARETPFIDYDQDYLIVFEKEESIKFFESKDEIIDYDSICNLSDEEIYNEIAKLRLELNNYSSKWLNSRQYYRANFNNPDYDPKIYALKYKIFTLEFYVMNRRKNQIKNCVNCALKYSPMQSMCNGDRQDCSEYINFIPVELLHNSDKRLKFENKMG